LTARFGAAGFVQHCATQTMPPLILVAEDDHDLRETVVWSLRAEGYRALGVDNGESALWALMMQPIDMLVVDVKLPKLDGTVVLRLMREDARMRYIPVVVITGFPDLAPPDLAVIRKPFPARLLIDVVNGILVSKPRRRTAENLPPIGAEQEAAQEQDQEQEKEQPDEELARVLASLGEGRTTGGGR
jgi:two-component system, OmpR family, response regulator ChvI